MMKYHEYRKEYECIRDYIECGDIGIDPILGGYVALNYRHCFVKGKRYEIVKATENSLFFKNEYGGKTEMEKRMASIFFQM